MIRYSLLLLLACCAFAQRPRFLTSREIGRAFASNIDADDQSSYIVRLVQLIINMADIKDAITQGIVLAQTVGVMTKLSDGTNGDNCYTAGIINAEASGVSQPELNSALELYINITMQGIDHIVTLVQDREAAKYLRGVAIGCERGGRDYDIEGAWDSIRERANDNNEDILNEEYTLVQNLYNSLYIESNNVGAAATAAALRSVNKVFRWAFGPVANFIRAVGGCRDSCLVNAASEAKAALAKAYRDYCYFYNYQGFIPFKSDRL